MNEHDQKFNYFSFFFSNIIILLEKNNANPNIIIPKLGISPLHFAAGFEDLSFAETVIEIFLKKNADPNLFSDCESKLTPLHISCVWNRPKIVKMLLEHGGDLDLKCNEGQTAIEYAIIQQNFEVVQEIQKFVFEQKIERKKRELIQSQKSQECFSTPPRTPHHGTPLKNSLTSVLQSIETKKFTPNRINYNFDVTSPYYINVTHRRHKTSQRTIEIEDNEENEKKAEAAEVIEVCNEKKNLFELTKKNLKEFSKQMSKAIVINRIAIHKRKSYILEWREKIQQILKDNDEVDKSYVDHLNNITHANSSLSNDEMIEIYSSTSASFTTAKSDLFRYENAIIDNAFIEETNNQVEYIENIVEHSDNENGIKIFERNRQSISRRNEAAESSLSTVVSIPPLDYDTDTLKNELKKFGSQPGPITKSTKRLYLKQLMKFKKHPEKLGLVQEEDSSRISMFFNFINKSNLLILILQLIHKNFNER